MSFYRDDDLFLVRRSVLAHRKPVATPYYTSGFMSQRSEKRNKANSSISSSPTSGVSIPKKKPLRNSLLLQAKSISTSHALVQNRDKNTKQQKRTRQRPGTADVGSLRTTERKVATRSKASASSRKAPRKAKNHFRGETKEEDEEEDRVNGTSTQKLRPRSAPVRTRLSQQVHRAQDLDEETILNGLQIYDDLAPESPECFRNPVDLRKKETREEYEKEEEQHPDDNLPKFVKWGDLDGNTSLSQAAYFFSLDPSSQVSKFRPRHLQSKRQDGILKKTCKQPLYHPFAQGAADEGPDDDGDFPPHSLIGRNTLLNAGPFRSIEQVQLEWAYENLE